MDNNKGGIDYVLLSATGILIILGILALTSVSTVFFLKKFGGFSYFLFHQIVVGLIPGLILGFAAFKISFARLKRWIPILLLGNLILMVLVFIPGIGVFSGGANRWIAFGGFSFQPSEFLKIIFILYLATLLESKVKNYKKGRVFQKKYSSLKKNGHFLKFKSKQIFDKEAFLPFLVIVGFTGLLLVLQSDLSTLGVIVFSAIVMYFLVGTPLWHTCLMFVIGLVGLAGLIKIVPYRMSRFLVFLNSELDPMGIGYQIRQSFIAVGSGGMFGLGLGMSIQKSGFLPESMSDSIFAIFAEETGFVGSFILVSVFLVFVWQGFNIAKKSQDMFSKLVAYGISSWIAFQAFINIGAMIGVAPLTGIPLPFFSYGGSHLVVELIAVGILLKISKQTMDC